jgi:hypothetical protein
MTLITVADDAGNDALAREMNELLDVAAPYVEKVTGLNVPTVSIHLGDRASTAQEYAAFVRRQIDVDTAGLNLTSRQRRQAEEFAQGIEWTVRMKWATTDSLLITASTGRPSTLIMPEALDRQGLTLDRSRLCALMVETLTKQAQVVACGARIILQPGWPILQNRHNDPTYHLSEGHALWTSRQVCPFLLNTVKPRREPWPARCHRALLAGDVGGQRRWRQRAASFVDKSLTAVGMEAFNLVWTEHQRLPTLAELRRPARWIRRQGIDG